MRRRLLLASCALAAVTLAPGSALAQLALNTAATLTNAGGAAPTVSQTPHLTDISLGAQRTILGWTTYNLTSDQTVVYRFLDASGIVLNKISGQGMIDGQVEALVGTTRGAGNVWFQAPGGVIFGPNARVNVGGLLATPGAVSGAFLNTSTSSFDFSGANTGQVTVRSGAQLKAGGGGLALIAGSVTTETGSTVTAASTILYGAASDFTVRFGAQAGDMDLLDFVVPGAGGSTATTPLNLQGQTLGGNVILAVVNRAEVASAVINAQGVIAAQSARSDGGDVILSAGVSIIARQPSTTRSNSTTATTANLGIVSAQRDVIGAFGSPTAIVATQIAAGRDLAVAALGLDVGTLNAGRTLLASGDRGITLRTTATSGGTASFRSTGAFSVGGGTGVITSIGKLQLDVGSVVAGQFNSGRSVVVNASGVGAANGPAVTIAAIQAADDITLTSTNASGHIVLGQALISGSGADEAPTGRILTLDAKGATADVTYGAAAGSTLVGVTGGVFTAGRDVTANVIGTLTLNSGSAGRHFTIRATDLDIKGALKAADLRIESTQGAITLGSASGSAPLEGRGAGLPGLVVTDSELQNITVTDQVSLYAGSGSVHGDFTVLNLSVNPVRIPKLLLVTGASDDLSVTGVLAPTVNGGTLIVGDPTDPTLQPGRILVSGSIGFSTGSSDAGFTGVRAFDEVDLNAVRDIVLGSQRFIGLIAGVDPSQIDVAHNKPAGVEPIADELGHIYLTAGTLSVAAQQRIIQMNTGTSTKVNGLLLNNLATNPTDNVLTINPAKVVDLFGVLRDKNGALRTGLAAGLGSIVKIEGGVATNIFLNGGSVGSGGGGGGGGSGSVQTSVQQASQSNAILGLAGGSSGSSSASSSGPSDALDAAAAAADPVAARLSPPPALVYVAPPSVEEVLSEPIVLGAGSDEIWRRHRDK